MTPEEDQTEKTFTEDFGTSPDTGETPKGKGYIELLVDNIIGLDNDYESFGEAFGKAFNEDELGTLKNMGISAYEGAKEFVTSPIDTFKDIATEISDSVYRLGAENLDGRLKRMYGIGYQDATEEQVTKAREAVIGDAITASSLVPAVRGTTAAVKTAVPGKIKADVVGQMRSFEEELLSDVDFEPLDEDFIPTHVVNADALKAEASLMMGEELSPESALSKMKKENSENLGLYKKGTILGDSAVEKEAIFGSLDDEDLLSIARNLPHPEDSTYGDYLEDTVKTVADLIGVSKNSLLEVVNDLGYYLPPKENPQLNLITEKPLPRKAPIGERAATDALPRASDLKAESLGFKDTVYHTSISPEEFTEFDLGRGFIGESRAAQDLLGVHVGTARAAAERNFQAVKSKDTPIGHTMELRARADDPLTKGDLARMLGKNPKDIFSPGDAPFTEADIGEAISLYEDKLFRGEVFPKNSRGLAAVALRRELAREGYTHIPYINDVEDPGSVSYIMLVDRPKGSPAVLRDVRAKFDPNKITSPDLRFAEGGMVEDEQINRLMAEGGLVDPKDNAVFRHHLENVRTGNSVKNEDGTVSTIRTIIMGDGENEYLIPTVWDGRILSDEEAFDKAMKSGIDWPKAPAGEKGVAYLEDLDKQIHSLPGFANGGLTTERQMNRLMAEGGMTDDGMTREPVTGNEIPPGSMAEEVRDDIPAQLSEGEYIIPADVVRFFGVKFFEDLRMQAKQGLAEMDAEGRIGGAKVDANGVPMEADEELTPEEEQMLREALGQSGMAYGGMAQAQSLANPYKNQPTTYQAQGMADGGLTNPEFDRTKFKLDPTATGGFETRKYINPQTGEERSFQFLNGMALGAIPDGFVPWTQELADQVKEVEEAPVKETRPESRDDSNENNFAGEDNLDSWASDNYEKLSADPFSFGMEALNKTGIEDFAGKAGKVPGAIGLAAKAASTFSRVEDISDAIASLNEMEARGLQGTEEYAELRSSIDDARENIGVGGLVGAGAQKLIDTTAKRKTTSYTNYGTSFSPTTTATRTTVTRDSDGGGSPYAPTTSPRPTPKPEGLGGSSTSVSQSTKDWSKSVQEGSAQAAGATTESKDFSTEGYSGKGYTQGRAKGGLVAKKTKQRKPRKTTKGLASDK